MEWIRNIFLGSIITFLLMTFVFKPFGKFSYPVMALIFLAILIGLMLIAWIFIRD